MELAPALGNLLMSLVSVSRPVSLWCCPRIWDRAEKQPQKGASSGNLCPLHGQWCWGLVKMELWMGQIQPPMSAPSSTAQVLTGHELPAGWSPVLGFHNLVAQRALPLVCWQRDSRVTPKCGGTALAFGQRCIQQTCCFPCSLSPPSKGLQASPPAIWCHFSLLCPPRELSAF